MKTCTRCKKPRTLEEFQRNPTASDGRRSVCKACMSSKAPAKQDPAEAAQANFQARMAREQLRAVNEKLAKRNAELETRIQQLENIGPIKIDLIKKGATTRDEEAVACVLISDLHVEEPVDPESVNGLNEYSPAIASMRMGHVFRNALRLTDICARDSKIKTIWMGLAGDTITNYLHPENAELNELPPEEAAELAQNLIASGIEFWLKESPYKIIIDCVAGNHGRMTQKPRNGNHSGTSIETFMYFNLAKYFRNNPRVEIRVARSKMLYRRFFENFTMRVIHGDDIGYQGGIGGVTIPIRKKIAAWDKSIRADLTVMGHFHQRIDGGDFLVNGSLIGYNAYAQGMGASPEEPCQSFFLVHSRNGGQKTITAPIWVTGGSKS